MTLRLDSRQVRQALAKLHLVPRQVPKTIFARFRDLVTDTLADAKARAPILEGHLRASGVKKVEKIGEMGMRGVITFGGLAEAYAEVQHQHEEFKHPKGGQAHYLFGKPTSGWNPLRELQLSKLVDRAAVGIENSLGQRSAL